MVLLGRLLSNPMHCADCLTRYYVFEHTHPYIHLGFYLSNVHSSPALRKPVIYHCALGNINSLYIYLISLIVVIRIPFLLVVSIQIIQVIIPWMSGFGWYIVFNPMTGKVWEELLTLSQPGKCVQNMQNRGEYRVRPTILRWAVCDLLLPTKFISYHFLHLPMMPAKYRSVRVWSCRWGQSPPDPMTTFCRHHI